MMRMTGCTFWRIFSIIFIFTTLSLISPAFSETPHVPHNITFQLNLLIDATHAPAAFTTLNIASQQLGLPFECPYQQNHDHAHPHEPDCYHHLQHYIEREHPGVKFRIALGNENLNDSIGVIGAFFSSDSVQFSREYATPNKLPMVSYGSTAIELSDKGDHPMFSRVVASNDLQATSMVDLCHRLGWTKRVVLLGSNDQYGLSGVDALLKYGMSYNMEILHDEIVEDALETLTRVKALNARYILLFAVSVIVKPLLFAAKQLNMLNGDYIFIFGESLGNVIEIKDGVVSFMDGQDNDLLPGLLFMQASTGFWTASDVFLRTEWEKLHPGVTLPVLSPYIYDSFLVFAHAVDKVISEHGPDAPRNGSLLFQHIIEENFLATTGRVFFARNGDRSSSPYILTNIDNNFHFSELSTWEVGRTFRMDRNTMILPGGKEMALQYDVDTVQIVGSTFNYYPIPDSSTPPAYRYSASCSYNYRDNQMVLFGGRLHGEQRYSDFWFYNLKEALWKQVFSFRTPSARSEHVSFVWSTKLGELYYSIFGGYNGQAVLEEQWNYRFSLNSWFQSDEVPVQARLRARTTSLNRDTYLVAGEGILYDRNDVWRFDHDDEQWIELNVTNSEVFIPRRDHCLTMYRGSLIVWAGRNEDNQAGLDDFYILPLKTKTWDRIYPQGDFPIARYNPVCETFNNKFYGGMGFSFHPKSPEGPFGDFFRMDLEPADGVYRFEQLNISHVSGFEGRDHVEWVLFGDRIMFFGGWAEHSVLNDFVRFSMSEEKVEIVHKSQATPPNVYAHTNGLVGNSMYIYGGTTLDGGVRYTNDLFKVNLDTFEWQQVFASGRQPPPSAGHVSVVYGDLIFVHGGLSASGYMADLWQYSTKRNRWTEISFESSQSVPTARAHHTGQIVENAATGRRSIFFLGGAIKHALLHDIWEFNLDLFQFSEIVAKTTTVEPPSAVVHMQSAVMNDHILLYSGEDRSVAPLKAVYAFSPDTHEWSIFATIPDALQTSRSRIAASKDALYIHGGSFFDKLEDWLLEVRNGTVRRINLEISAVRPERRSGHSLLFYQSRLLLFGGIGAIPTKTLLSDITIYNNLFEYRLGPLCAADPSVSEMGCVSCSPGTIRRLDVCVPCEEGTFSDDFGAASCTPCDVGFYNPIRGASSSKLCYPCEPGSFQDKPGASSCKPCDSDVHFCPIGSTQPLPKALRNVRNGKFTSNSEHPKKLPDKSSQMNLSTTASTVAAAVLSILWFLIFIMGWYWMRRCLFIADIFYNERHNYRIGVMRRKKTVAGGWFSVLYVVLWVAACYNVVFPFWADNEIDLKTLTPIGNNTVVEKLNITLTFQGPPATKIRCTADGGFDSWTTCHSSLQLSEHDYSSSGKWLRCRKHQPDSNNPPLCSIQVVYREFKVDSSVGQIGITVNEDNSFASYFSWVVSASSGYTIGDEYEMSTASGEKYSQQDTLYRGKQVPTVLSINYIQTYFKHKRRGETQGAHLENMLLENGSYVDSASFSSRNGFEFVFLFDVAENFYHVERTEKKQLLQTFAELGGATSLLLVITAIAMRFYESAQSILLNSRFARNSRFIQSLRKYERVKDRLEIVDEVKSKSENSLRHRKKYGGMKRSNSAPYVEMQDLENPLLSPNEAEDVMQSQGDNDTAYEVPENLFEIDRV